VLPDGLRRVGATEAVQIAHVIKYANQRVAAVDGVMSAKAATLVEVQTLGEKGLRYRHRLGRGVSDWLHLRSVTAPRLIDTCGSGDWCTAGFIAKIATGGQAEFRRTGARNLRNGLRFGQALAAWNCGFEGARGSMYAVSRKLFHQQITALLSAEFFREFKQSKMQRGPEKISYPAQPARPT
jgi:sugar/nucleoside kinase (ribokinase family)